MQGVNKSSWSGLIRVNCFALIALVRICTKTHYIYLRLCILATRIVKKISDFTFSPNMKNGDGKMQSLLPKGQFTDDLWMRAGFDSHKTLRFSLYMQTLG